MYGHTGPHLGRKGDRPSSRELADIQGQTEALRHFLSGSGKGKFTQGACYTMAQGKQSGDGWMVC